MKALILALFFTVASQAEPLSQTKVELKPVFLKCTGGVKKEFTTLALYSGGIKGGMFARIQQGSFDSGEIRIEEPSGMMMSDPGNRSYVDIASQGMHFSFSYNMSNPARFSRLDYLHPARLPNQLPDLTCAKPQVGIAKTN